MLKHTILKHLPKNALKKFEETMLYSKQPFYFNRTMLEWRTFSNTSANDITDSNINKRITKFHDQVKMSLFIESLYAILQTLEKQTFLLRSILG